MTLFSCEIKLRFVFCKNSNLSMYCKTRFDTLKSLFNLISKSMFDLPFFCLKKISNLFLFIDL
jgi:hypothetical protein